MTIIQGLIASISTGSPQTYTYSVTPTYTTLNEGVANDFVISTDNPNIDRLYWSITDLVGTNMTTGRFNQTDGDFGVSVGDGGNTGDITVDADYTTSPDAQGYSFRLYTDSNRFNEVAQVAISVNDSSFAVGGTLSVNGIPSNWGTTNATAPTYAAYTYPNNTSGSVHTLTGAEYVLSQAFGNASTLNFNLWFYPTANDKIIIGELGQTTEDSSWHLSMLEIDSSNKLKGRVWQTSPANAVTSLGSATLNAWNHVHFYYDTATTTFGMSLNNETPVTRNSGIARQASDTGQTYWGIGLTDSQNMGSSARYQGKFDALTIHSTLAGSNFDATKAKYNRVSLTSGTALGFSGSGQDVQVTDNRSDWALGNTWTIEWWEKMDADANSFHGVMSQDSNDGGVPSYTGPLGFDIFHANGAIQMFNGRWTFAEPTRGQWNHIAIQKNGAAVTPYVNGTAVGLVSFTDPTRTLANSDLDLIIGLRSPNGVTPGYGQWFKGQLANIKISNVARYADLTLFSPPITVDGDANTVLALDSIVGSGGMLVDEMTRHILTNNNTTAVTIT